MNEAKGHYLAEHIHCNVTTAEVKSQPLPVDDDKEVLKEDEKPKENEE